MESRKGDFAAAAVAVTYFNIVWYFIEGVLTAQDTLCASAFGKLLMIYI